MYSGQIQAQVSIIFPLFIQRYCKTNQMQDPPKSQIAKLFLPILSESRKAEFFRPSRQSKSVPPFGNNIQIKKRIQGSQPKPNSQMKTNAHQNNFDQFQYASISGQKPKCALEKLRQEFDKHQALNEGEEEKEPCKETNNDHCWSRFYIQNLQLQLQANGRINRRKDTRRKQQVRKKEEEVRRSKQRKSAEVQFYSSSKYKFDNYIKILCNYGNHVLSQQRTQDTEQQAQSCRQKFKQAINKILFQKLDECMKQQDDLNKVCLQGKVVESLYQYYHSMLDQQSVNWSLYGLKDNCADSKLKQALISMAIDSAVKRLKQKIKVGKNVKLYQYSIRQLFQIQDTNTNFLDLTAISITQSHVSKSKILYNIAQQAISTIKNSSFIHMLYCQFFKYRQKCDFSHNKLKIDKEMIRSIMQKTKVILYDCSNQKINGVTKPSKSEDDNSIIFINTYNLFKISEDQKEEHVQTYLFYILVHQFAHALIREMKLIQNETSNPHDSENDGFNDGGFLFEVYLLGKRIQGVFTGDYNYILQILNLSESQLPTLDFSQHQQRLAKQIQKQKKIANKEKLQTEKTIKNFGPKERQAALKIYSLLQKQIKLINQDSLEEQRQFIENQGMKGTKRKMMTQNVKFLQISQISHEQASNIMQKIQKLFKFGHRSRYNTSSNGKYFLLRNGAQGTYFLIGRCGGCPGSRRRKQIYYDKIYSSSDSSSDQMQSPS